MSVWPYLLAPHFEASGYALLHLFGLRLLLTRLERECTSGLASWYDRMQPPFLAAFSTYAPVHAESTVGADEYRPLALQFYMLGGSLALHLPLWLQSFWWSTVWNPYPQYLLYLPVSMLSDWYWTLQLDLLRLLFLSTAFIGSFFLLIGSLPVLHVKTYAKEWYLIRPVHNVTLDYRWRWRYKASDHGRFSFQVRVGVPPVDGFEEHSSPSRATGRHRWVLLGSHHPVSIEVRREQLLRLELLESKPTKPEWAPPNTLCLAATSQVDDLLETLDPITYLSQMRPFLDDYHPLLGLASLTKQQPKLGHVEADVLKDVEGRLQKHPEVKEEGPLSSWRASYAQHRAQSKRKSSGLRSQKSQSHDSAKEDSTRFLPIVCDSGASFSCTPRREDFVGPIRKAHVQEVTGLSEKCPVQGVGTV